MTTTATPKPSCPLRPQGRPENRFPTPVERKKGRRGSGVESQTNRAAVLFQGQVFR